MNEINSVRWLFIMKNGCELKVLLNNRGGLTFEYPWNGLRFNLRASQWLKNFPVVFKIYITENNGWVKVSLAMKVIFIKKGFLIIFANTDPPSYKGEPFYFSKRIMFFGRYFSIRKSWVEIHFDHIIAITQKSGSSKIDKKGLSDILMIIRVFF